MTVDRQQHTKREAHAWLARLSSGRATAADAEAVKLWCDQSPEHAKALAEATLLWDALAPVAQHLASRSAHVAPLAPQPRLSRRAIVVGALATSAAAALGYVMMRPPFALWPSVFDLTADYRTGTGDRRIVAVEGGISVELNTRTSLNVRGEAGQARHIELVSGEAAIATGNALAQPIVVSASGGLVIASDAKFDVRCDGATSSVTCLQGTVRVEHGNRIVTLLPSQQISYSDDAGLGPATIIDPTAVMAWRDGRLVFHGVLLAQVVEEVNRYRRGRIILMNATLGRRSLDATFPLDRTDDFIRLVRSAYGAEVTILPGGIVILS